MRMIAGIAGLVGLTIALSEAVLASACTPDMDMQGMAMESAPNPNRPEKPAEPKGQEDGPICPFGQFTAQNCGAAASLPSIEVAVPNPPAAIAARLSFHVSRHGLLVASVLFHPPRA